jgi:hypothetical protein
MEENIIEQEELKEKPLAFWILVLAGILAAVIGIFAMLEFVVPQNVERSSGSWSALSTQSGSLSPYSMRLVGEKDRKSDDVSAWLTACGDTIAQDLGGEAEDTVFWLYRQDSDEYLLYLPEQDRALTSRDVTAGEEKDEDGAKRLVIRVRTPEEGEEVDPKAQLLCFRTESVSWNGIRLTIVLDGREQEVRVLTSSGGKLFTTEQSYIGRN